MIPFKQMHNFLGPLGANVEGDVTEVYLKRMEFVDDKWESNTHDHKTDHVTVLVEGTLEMDIAGESYTFTAPAFIPVAADVRHRLRALSKVIAYCLHITNHNNPEDIDKVLIQEKKHANS